MANVNEKPNTNDDVSDVMKKKILTELVEPAYYSDIQASIRARFRWKLLCHIFETTAKVLIATGGIVSFSSGYLHNTTLAFCSGCLSVSGIACSQFASYCLKECNENTEQLNTTLQSIKLDGLPEVIAVACVLL